MKEWSFLTNHARPWSVSPTTRGTVRDIAMTVGITERSAYAIVTDLAAAGYVVKDKDTDGRRNRYQIQAHLPLPGRIGRERTIGEVLDVLVDSAPDRPGHDNLGIPGPRASQIRGAHPRARLLCRRPRPQRGRRAGLGGSRDDPLG